MHCVKCAGTHTTWNLQNSLYSAQKSIDIGALAAFRMSLNVIFVYYIKPRISLGLIHNAGMLLASNRKLIFGGPVIALGLTGKSLSAVK